MFETVNHGGPGVASGRNQNAFQPRMALMTQRGLAALGRNQKFLEQERHHKMLWIKMLQTLEIKIEHGKQRFAGL